MIKSIATDLVDASDITEHLLKKLPDLSLDDKIDIAARLRAVVKNCGAIDEIIKDEIKKKLRNKEGTLLGDVFKCSLTIVPTMRFDSAAFKADHADLYEKYSAPQDQKRITFEPR